MNTEWALGITIGGGTLPWQQKKKKENEMLQTPDKAHEFSAHIRGQSNSTAQKAASRVIAEQYT